MGNGKLLIFFLDAALVIECLSFLHSIWLFTTSTTSKPECSIYNDEQLHIIMDRVCEICHEMYSHQYPNTRADCRFAACKFFSIFKFNKKELYFGMLC